MVEMAPDGCHCRAELDVAEAVVQHRSQVFEYGEDGYGAKVGQHGVADVLLVLL